MVVTVAFAVGIRQTVEWLDGRALWGLVVAGPLAFGAVALAGIAFGGAFLQFDVLPVGKASVYATEAIEVGIGATVAAAVVVLFVRIADGYSEPADVSSSSDAVEEVGSRD
jgi:multicomponent Na+:H+ antiporter subunit B